MFYYFWGKENRPLYQRLRYIEVRYVEVLLYVLISYHRENYSVVIGLVLFSETAFLVDLKSWWIKLTQKTTISTCWEI